MKANAKALQKYLQDKRAIVTVYPGDSKFLEWFNSQKDRAFEAGFFLGHNDKGAFKMTDATSFTPEDAAQMRSGVMTKGATWTWAGCGTAEFGTVNDFVSVSSFNQSGITWGERGAGSFDVWNWDNPKRPTVGTGIPSARGALGRSVQRRCEMSRRDICTRFEAAPALRWRAGVLLLVANAPISGTGRRARRDLCLGGPSGRPGSGNVLSRQTVHARAEPDRRDPSHRVRDVASRGTHRRAIHDSRA